MRDGNAARVADRQRARPAESVQRADDQAAATRAGHRRRRCGHGVRCMRHDGARRGRDPDEHGDRGGAGPGRDRRLAYELSAGVLRRQRELDCALELDRADPRLHDVLRLGAYQLRWLTRVPSHAAVSTSVELARETVGEGSTGYVNRTLRQLSAIGYRLSGNSPTHPDWLVDRWKSRFGPDETARLMEWNDKKPELFLHPARWTQVRLLAPPR